MEFKPCAEVVEETYLGEDGAEIIKYKIGKKHYDKQELKESGINIEDLYLPEDKIHLMIKNSLTALTIFQTWQNPPKPSAGSIYPSQAISRDQIKT